jgi:hypothetical protein
LKWRLGSPLEILALNCRFDCLTSQIGKAILRNHVVGYADGQQVPCRAKEGTIAVMFFKGEEHFWFHLRDAEFEAVFGAPKIARWWLSSSFTAKM